MALLTVTILSVIAHLALGQGWGHLGAMGGGWGMHSGWGKESGWGKDMGWGKDEGWEQDKGWGMGMHSGWGKGMHSGWGSGWGQQSWEKSEYDETTITCTFEDMDITGSVTLREKKSSGGWGWGQKKEGVSGELRINTGEFDPGTFSVVIAERGRVEGGCTTDGLGPILKKSSWGHSWGNWGDGVIKTIDLTSIGHFTIDLHSKLPFDRLKSYAGRSLAICTDVTTDMHGEPECDMPVACCKLGYDNQDAETPPAPGEGY